MKFKAARPSETTLDIVLEDVEVRFTPSGKRVARVHAAGLDSIVFQMWGNDSPADDERFQKLIDVPSGTILTVTGRAKEEDYEFPKGGIHKRRTFTIDTWTDNRADGETPANITEVPF